MSKSKDFQTAFSFLSGDGKPSGVMDEQTRSNAVISDLLRSPVRSKIVAWFILKPKERFTIKELHSILTTDAGIIKQELPVLKDAGILKSEMVHRKELYALNPECYFLKRLKEIVARTDPFIQKLKEVLGRDPKIDFAFIYGSLTTEKDPGKSALDLLIIGHADIDLDTLRSELPAFGHLGRQAINITFFTVNEYHRRRRTVESSLSQILLQPRTWLVGNEDALSGNLP